MPPGVSAVMGQGTDHCVIARRLRSRDGRRESALRVIAWSDRAPHHLEVTRVGGAYPSYR